MQGPFYESYSKTYLIDDIKSEQLGNSEKGIEWKKHKSFAQVAYVCLCYNDTSIGHDQEEKIKKEYCQLFPDDETFSKFDYIHDNFKNIRGTFMLHMIEEEQYQKESSAVILIEKQFFYCRLANENPESGSLTEYLSSDKYTGITIHAYTSTMDPAQGKTAANNWLKNINHEQTTLIIFTNKDKNRYTYYETDEPNKLKLQINPNPARRNKQKENFFYVLCPHAALATDALHYIVEFISSKDFNPGSITLLSRQVRSSHSSSELPSPTDAHTLPPIENIDNESQRSQTDDAQYIPDSVYLSNLEDAEYVSRAIQEQ